MAENREIVLVGAGSHAVSVVDLIESTNEFLILGLLDNRLAEEESFLDYVCLGSMDSVNKWVDGNRNFFVSVGQIGGPGIREDLYRVLVSLGAIVASPVSPFAYVSPRSSLGLGTAVFHGAVVNAGASVGENCIINSQSLLEHDAKVGSHSHIATGARINGEASIGSRCFVGSGAVIFQGCQIPDDSVVPAGAVVRRWPLDA